MNIKNEDDVYEYAKNLYKTGPNCAECVLETLIASNITDLKKEDVRLATGFGGGIGGYRLTCGALTGAVIAVSSVYGRKNPSALKELSYIKEELINEKEGIYKIFHKLASDFEKEAESSLCSEIIKANGGYNSIERARRCKELVGVAAKLAYSSIIKR